jgi:hypothetical protein
MTDATPPAEAHYTKARKYDIVAFVVKPEGVIEPLLQPEPTEEERKKLEAPLPPIWHWHSGEGALCHVVNGPQGNPVWVGLKTSRLRDAGWNVDELEMSRLLPRPSIQGANRLAVGANSADVKKAAQQEAMNRAAAAAIRRGR